MWRTKEILSARKRMQLYREGPTTKHRTPVMQYELLAVPQIVQQSTSGIDMQHSIMYRHLPALYIDHIDRAK